MLNSSYILARICALSASRMLRCASVLGYAKAAGHSARRCPMLRRYSYQGACRDPAKAQAARRSGRKSRSRPSASARERAGAARCPGVGVHECCEASTRHACAMLSTFARWRARAASAVRQERVKVRKHMATSCWYDARSSARGMVLQARVMRLRRCLPQRCWRRRNRAAVA